MLRDVCVDVFVIARLATVLRPAQEFLTYMDTSEILEVIGEIYTIPSRNRYATYLYISVI
jgi:hypothetical protein